LCACVAALVLTSTLVAGRAYLWCSMMAASVETCCCPAEHDELGLGDHERSPEVENGCCQGHAHDDLTKGHVAADTLEVPPALPARAAAAPAIVVPTPLASYPPASPARASRASPIRAGPRPASDTCARLQVYRC
jgi:hypothetical protein